MSRIDLPSRFVQTFVQTRANIVFVFLDFRNCRPVRRHVCWQPTPDGIDSECEKFVGFFVLRQKVQRAAEQIPVEGLQMAQVEDQPVAFRNRPVIKRIRRQQIE